MYSVTIVSESSVFIRNNLNYQEMLKVYKEWIENNLNVYSSFFFEEKGTNKSAHFFKKADGTVEKCQL